MNPDTPLTVVTPISARGYAHPEVLVSTEWVAAHLDDPKVRIVESDEDLLLYETGHIPGAVKIDWVTDLNDPLRRDYVSRDSMETLLRSKGISSDTTVVLYGDKNNWWAAYSFWVLRLFGLGNLRLMDGGRLRWAEEGRPLVTDASSYPPGNITVPARNDVPIRAFRCDVLNHVEAGRRLVDVRAPRNTAASACTWRLSQRGSPQGRAHSGARSIPWARAVDPATHCFRRPANCERSIRRRMVLSQRGDDRLLPYRRAVFAHLVRADLPPRLQPGAQLRRQLDRVGQWSGTPDRALGTHPRIHQGRPAGRPFL
jgi:thiosulfate/3-mercaptopyruvate sulfurtransferase